MCSRVFLCLIGAVHLHIYFQVLAAVEDVYIAELMVESNVTLESSTILSAFNLITAVSDNTTSHQVTLSHSELIAECLIVGDESTCNCSTGYIWSNQVCDKYNCCRETPCAQNVSQITPLCVAKVKVHINGSVTLNADDWSPTKNTELETKFEDLNGFEYLNTTGPRLDNNNKVIDFEAAVSVKFPTSKLQTIINDLEISFGAVLKVDTIGLVTIEAPETPVCYKSVPVLKCTFEERTGSAGWSLNKKYQRFELNTGSVVKLLSNCTTPQYNSCIIVTLQEATGLWSGLYECGFTSGSVRHTAKAPLNVTLLPDTIAMKINPLSADCSELDKVPVMVTATISKTNEHFVVLWHHMGKEENNQNMKSVGDYQVYTFTANVDCDNKNDQHVSVSFKNIKNQTKSAEVHIPVVHGGTIFCKEDDFWPKSPAGDTVINNTCEAGRVGYKSRTCEVTGNWQDVFFYCINEELNKVSNAADNFLKGLGATQEMAMNIFTELKNISTSESYSSDSIADVIASINILDVMARASEKITLQADILPNFISAASNMLDKSWEEVNDSVVQNMSSNYLQSVESLVKNIKIGSNASNASNIFSPNLQLKFCSSSNCNVSVFGIGVNLNKTTGILKVVAIKNLTNNLRNDFLDTLPTSLLISATLENNSDSFLEIKLEFPEKTLNDNTKPYCVFWNTSEKDWSDRGCFVEPSNGDRAGQVVCECNHLTSFSVLMAKGDISNDVLDIITYVGLGVSIFSLLIFLTVESLVWSAVVKSNLSHFRHTAMVNIATFLLLADCSFLASTGGVSETLCLVLTVCKHLFFLAMFSWMLCMSVMLVHQLIFVFSPLRKRVFMFLSSIIGYVCPILIVGSSYVYCKYTNKQYYNKKTCWLVYERLLEGSIHAFILPVGTVILTNLFSMVVVITTLVKSSAPDASKVDDKETAKSIIKVVVFLTPVFGVTWIIGFAQLLLDEDDPMVTVASYSFTILNSFQGLFLLLTGCFAEQKVREEMLKLIMAKSNGKSESMKNLTSTTYTKDK